MSAKSLLKFIIGKGIPENNITLDIFLEINSTEFQWQLLLILALFEGNERYRSLQLLQYFYESKIYFESSGLMEINKIKRTSTNKIRVFIEILSFKTYLYAVYYFCANIVQQKLFE